MKTQLITVLMAISCMQLAFAEQVSKGHSKDNGSIRIIREIR